MRAIGQSVGESSGRRRRKCSSNTGCGVLHCISGGSNAKPLGSRSEASRFHCKRSRHPGSDSNCDGPRLPGRTTGGLFHCQSSPGPKCLANPALFFHLEISLPLPLRSGHNRWYFGI